MQQQVARGFANACSALASMSRAQAHLGGASAIRAGGAQVFLVQQAIDGGALPAAQWAHDQHGRGQREVCMHAAGSVQKQRLA